MIVTDASAVADALVDDGKAGVAARAALIDDVEWAAPSHLFIEVISVIRGLLLGRKISAGRADDALAALPEIAVETVDHVDLMGRIWQLRTVLTPYDAAYVAAAELLDCPLVTADARLARAPGLMCPIRVTV